jgi:hypothetical protein
MPAVCPLAGQLTQPAYALSRNFRGRCDGSGEGQPTESNCDVVFAVHALPNTEQRSTSSL